MESATPAGVDLGLFGPGSLAWRVHSEPAMLVGGLRALMVQALHPLAIAAVADHSSYRSDVFGRFMRTTDYVLTTSRGSMISRADLLRDLKLVKIEPYEPSEVVVRIYGDTAVITGRIVQKYSTNGEHIEADLRYTDVWLKTKEGWKNSAGHASAIKVTRTKEKTR